MHFNKQHHPPSTSSYKLLCIDKPPPTSDWRLRSPHPRHGLIVHPGLQVVENGEIVGMRRSFLSSFVLQWRPKLPDRPRHKLSKVRKENTFYSLDTHCQQSAP